jgi:hypothetical protein
MNRIIYPFIAADYSKNKKIQDNKKCHDDHPKTLAFQVSLRYYGFG